LQAIANALANLHDKTVTVNVVPGGRGIGIGGRASGGGLPEGVAAVGEQGPELAIKRGSNVQILSNSQSKAYLSRDRDQGARVRVRHVEPARVQDVARQGRVVGDGTRSSSCWRSAEGRDLLRAGEAVDGENRGLGTAITRPEPARRQAVPRQSAARRRAEEARRRGRRGEGRHHRVVRRHHRRDGVRREPADHRPKNMLAEEKQAANRARMFVAAIKKLKGKIGAGYLYQLAEKGPSALPEAQALLSLNKSDLSAFNAARRR
jgi:hypothetical protein